MTYRNGKILMWKNKLYGFRREDGRIGIRNYVAVMAAGDDANPLARRLAEDVPGVLYLPASYGCGQLGEDLELALRTMAGLAGHPNVSGSLIVSFEPEIAYRISSRVPAGSGKTATLSLLQAGGFTSARMAGQGILFRLWEEAQAQKRKPFSIGDLLIGLECEGSDTPSGMVADPAIDLFSDRLVDAGASAIFSEPLECIEGKSMGAVSKSGTRPIQGVLAYGERPAGKGLYFMDAPAAAVENLGPLTITTVPWAWCAIFIFLQALIAVCRNVGQ
ncbi:MAG: hypothetical protein C4530_06905 [Desulfobacteraceae bacterium]|nr:MAG: hypothetical protein C4530_06905 [Desulfobacteraceae bacterium]